ncbi:hypothetical protein SIO70_26325 [Chitinophaga sancti]|uniref:hypothetical protein n=1 Tax=Chitinophaga sancti TaxID=1004 RepID=UPI002A757F7D|nr:hypothetical protein [Chitinophaga sancti]WPQ61882.1 hypothetical protein SIO70_26325 [Chitinophaga sancti]
MKDFSISLYISPEVKFKLGIINQFNELILSFLKPRFYGIGVEYLFIGLNCMNQRSLKILKLRKPKYIGPPKIIKMPGLEDRVLEKAIEYEFIVDYAEIMNADDDKVIGIIKSNLINSITAIDVLKIPDFDKEKFKKDFIECVSQIQI